MLQRGMATHIDVARIPDETLLADVKRAAADERHATVQLIALLGEVDARRLYLGEGCSSLFTYCTQVLHLSENGAYFRMEAARAARTYPFILGLLEEGALTLTAVRLLRAHLTPANHREVLEAARHKSKHEVERLVARLRPQPAVPPSVRKLPSVPPSSGCAPVSQHDRIESAPTTTEQSGNAATLMLDISASRRPVVKPLAPERYKVQFTVSAETHAKLRQVQDLLRHSVPNGDPGEILERGLRLLLEHLQKTKLAKAERPRGRAPRPTESRHIPAAVKREVWSRDGGRCAFIGTHGRCTETGFLEFHHVEPYAAGGAATSQNIQ